jgi:hypothetical protein
MILTLFLVFSAIAGPHAELAAVQSRWMDAYNQQDARLLEEIEANDFRIAFGDGRIETKAEQVENQKKARPAGVEYKITIESTEYRVYGKAAVLTGVVVERGKYVDAKGALQPFEQRSRYTDTWILEKGRWRVVSSHLSDLK